MQAPLSSPLDWQRDGADWPHREASRFVSAGGLGWHVQQFGPPLGQAPVALLIHGTGASSHSWRGLAPLLAPHFSVLAPDLPGHAFTSAPPPRQLSVDGMAAALSALLQQLGVSPGQVQLLAGHSAGAAIGVRMTTDGQVRPQALVSVNGALLPLAGVMGRLATPAARLLASSAWVPRLFAWRASQASVLQRLVDATGSTLDAQGMALYGRLVACPAHAAAALGMMAQWDLGPVEAALARLPVPLHLLVGTNDLTVPPAQARRVMLRAPGAQYASLHGLGHLAHEEQPALVARRMLAAAGIAHGH